jgi:hypothetical protein
MGEMRNVYKIPVGKQLGENRIEGTGADGRIILKQRLNE